MEHCKQRYFQGNDSTFLASAMSECGSGSENHASRDFLPGNPQQQAVHHFSKNRCDLKWTWSRLKVVPNEKFSFECGLKWTGLKWMLSQISWSQINWSQQSWNRSSHDDISQLGSEQQDKMTTRQQRQVQTAFCAHFYEHPLPLCVNFFFW